MPAWQHIVHHRKTWFDRVTAILSRAGQPRIELNDFPAQDLEAVVREHLRESNLTPGTRNTEKHLLDSVRDYPFPDPTVKFGTVLASLPCVSGPVGRDLLRCCVNPDATAGNFYQGAVYRPPQGPLRAGPLKLSATAICLARRANPAVVTEAEHNCALHLLRYAGTSAMTYGQWIRAFLRLWVSLPMHHLLVHPNIEMLFQDACTRFLGELEQCEKGHHYHDARTASKWLVPFLIDPITGQQSDMQQLPLLTVRSSTASNDSTSSAVLLDQIHEMLGDLGSPTINPRLARSELPAEFVIGNNAGGRRNPNPNNQNQHPSALLPGRLHPTNPAQTPQMSSTPRRSAEQPREGSGSPIGSSVRIYAQILNRYMPAWRSWASWQPDAQRIERWSSFRESDRMALNNLLALEARDQSQSASKTIFEGLLCQVRGTDQHVVYGDLELDVPEDEARELLGRLYTALDAAQLLGDRGLDIYISLSASEYVGMIPELFDAMPPEAFGDRALEGLATVLKEENNVAQLDSLVALMEASRDNSEICDLLRPILLNSIHATFATAQEDFKGQVEKGRVAKELGMTLYQFATVLQGNSWLDDAFEQNLQAILSGLPSEDTLQRVFEYRSLVQNRRSYELRNDPTSGWLLARFRGDSSQFDMPDSIMDALSTAWKRKLSSDGQNIALALLRMDGVDFGIMQACLTELPNAPSWFTRKWLPVMTSSVEYPYVQMAEILVLAGDHLEKPPYSPWLQLWAWKFHNLEPESLVPLAKRLPLLKWFSWTRSVTALLNTNALQHADGLRRTTSWATELLTKYKAPLARLSAMLGDEVSPPWLLVQSSDPAVRILDELEYDPGDEHWASQAEIIKRLKLDGSNADSIAEELQQVTVTSDRSSEVAVALAGNIGSTAPVDAGSINSWESEESPPGYEDTQEWTQNRQASLKSVQHIPPPVLEPEFRNLNLD